MIYFAYELSKVIFALIALYEVAVNFARVIADVGLHYRMMREAPPMLYNKRKEEAVRTIIWPAAFTRVFVGFITAILFFILCHILRDDLQQSFPELDISFVIAACTIHLFMTLCEGVTSSVYNVRQLFGTDAFLETSSNLLERIFAVVFYLWLGLNYYFIGIAIAITITVAVRLYFIRDYFPYCSFKELNAASMWKVVKEYSPFYLRKFFRIGFKQGELLIIPILLPMEQLANFKLASKTAGMLRKYIQAFSDPLIVKMSRTRDINVRQEYVRTYLAFTLPPPIILAFLSPWIMPIMGGAKYADAWFMLAIVFASYIFSALSILQLTIISIFGKPTEFLLRDAIGGIVGLVATFLFILAFGEYGVAWGQLLSYAILFAVGYKIANRYIKAQAPSTISESVDPLSTYKN
jgi:O-antigen/teichoic acid export membrane protein